MKNDEENQKDFKIFCKKINHLIQGEIKDGISIPVIECALLSCASSVVSLGINRQESIASASKLFNTMMNKSFDFKEELEKNGIEIYGHED